MPDHPDFDVGAAVTDAADRLATRTPAIAEVTKRSAQRRQRRIAIGAGLASVVLTVVVAVGLSFDGDRTVTEAPIATDGETSSTTTTTTTTVVDPDQETVAATIDEVPLIPSDLPAGFALRGFSSGAPGVDENHRPSRTYALRDGDELMGVIQVSSTSSSEFEGWQGAIDFEVDGRPAGLFVINSSQASARVEIDDERSIVVFVEVRTSDEVDIEALRQVLAGGVITEDGPAVEPEALPVGYRLVDEDLVPENVTSEMVTIFGDGTRELVLIQRRGELRGLDRRTCCRTIWTETTMGVDDEYVGVTNLFDPGPLIEPEPGLQIRFQSSDFTEAELDRVVSSLHRPAVTDWEPLVERVASTPPSSARAPEGVTFLAPGPLDRREGSAQTASDSEILIWGGRTDTEDRSDGAAYDVADES